MGYFSSALTSKEIGAKKRKSQKLSLLHSSMLFSLLDTVNFST